MTNVKLSFYVIIILLTNITVFGENSTTKIGTIVLVINDIKEERGVFHSHLFNDINPELFPTKSREAYKMQTVKINPNITKIIFSDIPFGKYALTVHQDLNINNKLDKNFIGYPAEPFGLSNNPKLTLSIPKFDKCSFILDKDTLHLNIRMNFL